MVATSDLPLLLVGADTPRFTTDPRTFCVIFDDSDEARRAIDCAVGWADEERDSLLICVVGPASGEAGGDGDDDAGLDAKLVEVVRRTAESAETSVAGVDVSHIATPSGSSEADVVAAIVAEADSSNATAIFVGRSTLNDLLGGIGSALVSSPDGPAAVVVP